MALQTTYRLSLNSTLGANAYVKVRDLANNQVYTVTYPGAQVVITSNAPLRIIELHSPIGYSSIENCGVHAVTYSASGQELGVSDFSAGADPQIDPVTVPGAYRVITFRLYIPPIPETTYVFHTSYDIGRYRVVAGFDLYDVTPDNEPVEFEYDGDVYISVVFDTKGEGVPHDKVLIAWDGTDEQVMSDSPTIPEKPNGRRIVYVTNFAPWYQVTARSMQSGLSFDLVVDGESAGTAVYLAPATALVNARSQVYLSNFSHPAAYGRPWLVYADAAGEWQEDDPEETSGSYKLWFAPRGRRVQAKASSKRDMEFNWWSRVYDPVKIAPKKNFSLNMMATVWNRFSAKVAETYRRWNMTPAAVPTVASGDELTAETFNAAVAAVAGLPGVTAAPPAAETGKVVKAAYFQGSGSLKGALNQSIHAWMDADD